MTHPNGDGCVVEGVRDYRIYRIVTLEAGLVQEFRLR